jgi:hypothetical protein
MDGEEEEYGELELFLNSEDHCDEVLTISPSLTLRERPDSGKDQTGPSASASPVVVEPKESKRIPLPSPSPTRAESENPKIGVRVRPDTLLKDKTTFAALGPVMQAEEGLGYTWKAYAASVVIKGTQDYDSTADGLDTSIRDLVDQHQVQIKGAISEGYPSRMDHVLVEAYIDVQKSIARAVDTLHAARLLLQGSYPPQYLEARLSMERKPQLDGFALTVKVSVKDEYKVAGDTAPVGEVKTSLAEIITRLQRFIREATGILRKDYALVLCNYTMESAYERVLTNLVELEDDPFPDLDDEFKTPEYFGKQLAQLSQNIKRMEKDRSSSKEERLTWMKGIGTYQALLRTIQSVQKQIVRMERFFYLGTYPSGVRGREDVRSITCAVFPKQPMAFRDKIFRFRIALIQYLGIARSLRKFASAARRKF